MQRNKKPRPPKGNGAAFVRLYHRAVKPVLAWLLPTGIR